VTATGTRTLTVVLGDQLLPPHEVGLRAGSVVFMAEDRELCTRIRHHQQKLTLFIAAMRGYRDALRERRCIVAYHELGDAPSSSFEDKLLQGLRNFGCDEVRHCEIDDDFMEQRLAAFAQRHALKRIVATSPKFLGDGGYFDELGNDARPRMVDFYRRQRRRLNVLLTPAGKPVGGRWSFDSDNRRRLPIKLRPPAVEWPQQEPHVRAVQQLVKREFAGHPGNADDFWLPSTRSGALRWLDDFLVRRFHEFGPYEDAISSSSATLYHSVLSPVLNLGLVTPREVLDRALAFASEHAVPLQSVEGFVRQLIGWREFVRGVYRRFGRAEESANFWGHERTLTAHWYDATTGVEPLDDTIRTVARLGWSHHITRLMIVGNLMTLAEIEPRAAHRWFMEHYVDSADWVMGPNVYGMGIYSDGGVFATKPYLCSSNYLRKLSDYPPGPWCDVVDGLYWRFIAKHERFFAAQPRLAQAARALARLDATRRARITAAAEDFLERCTGAL
jgi:deoxyribodipyrimidine photolyase-related protein